MKYNLNSVFIDMAFDASVSTSREKSRICKFF